MKGLLTKPVSETKSHFSCCNQKKKEKEVAPLLGVFVESEERVCAPGKEEKDCVCREGV